MAGWMVRIDDKDYPAQSIDELRAWALAGRIQSGHYVYNPTLEKWLYARDVEELKPVMNAAQKTPTPSRLNKPMATWAIPVILLGLGAWVFWDQPNPFGIDQLTFAPMLLLAAVLITVIGFRRNSRRARGLP
jgi:hypothetical protein